MPDAEDKAPAVQKDAGGENKPEEPDKPKSQATQSGSTGGKRNKRNRRNKGGRARSPGTTNETTQNTKFKGRCDELKGSIFSLGAYQADTYIKSKKELCIYVGTIYSMDVRRALEDLKPHQFPMPSMPRIKDAISGEFRDKTENEMNYLEKKRLDIQLKQQMDKEDQYKKDMEQIYSTIEGQCTDGLIQKLKSFKEYETAKGEADPIGLLKIIKKIAYSYQSEQFPILSLVKAFKRLASMKQGLKESNFFPTQHLYILKR